MRAITYHEYGPPDVLRLEEVERPTPAAGEALVRVRAASVNPADWHFMRADPALVRLQAGLRAPKDAILGCDIAGEVEALGEGVSGLAVGDEVFGCTFMRGFGGFAEYAAVAAELLAAKPAGLSFEQAAVVPIAGMTALQGLRDKAGLERGHKVVIVGASGGVGTFAIQVAKELGAEVTGVCGPTNGELVSSLGAGDVIDYSQDDFIESGRRWDVVFQLAGQHSPLACRRALTETGTLLLSSGDSDGRIVGPVARSIVAALSSPFVSQRLVSFTVKPTGDDLRSLTSLIEAGAVTPVIDRTYELADVPDAIRYVEDGHARGKVAVTV